MYAGRFDGYDLLLLFTFLLLISLSDTVLQIRSVNKTMEILFLQKLQFVLKILFGDADKWMYALIALISIDYITGVCVAIYQKKLSSTIGAKGIAKKIAILALVSLSHFMDEYILESGNALRLVTTIFYISNEAMSVLENVGALGVPLPQKLADIISHFDKYSTKK